MSDKIAYGKAPNAPCFKIPPLGAKMAHHFTLRRVDKDGIRLFEAACGIQVTDAPRARMLNPGNFPRCKRCEKVLEKFELEYKVQQ